MKDMDWQTADANPEQLLKPMDKPADAINVDGTIYYSVEAVGQLCATHRKLERERIIKELEVCEDGHSMPEGDGRWAIVLRTAISIVRGEGK